MEADENKMLVYEGLITKLRPNQIFVFGSNTQGRHGKGAALWALKNAGAIYGQARGLQGQSYAIVTKDLTKISHPSVSREDILKEIRELYFFADSMPNYHFMIAYSAKGQFLNGYTAYNMINMFYWATPFIPSNIVFEKEFLAQVRSKERMKNIEIN